jgi:hypothetical protein
MKYLVWLLVLLLVVLHHDVWNWHDTALIGGLLPVGLGYHMALTLAAAVTWYLATRFCWPADLPAEEQP